MSAERIAIGHGVEIEFFIGSGGTEQGILESHPRPDTGERCFGAVFWDRSGATQPGPTWRLISREPLTLEPSILCRLCGNHGFIREGKWVPA